MSLYAIDLTFEARNDLNLSESMDIMKLTTRPAVTSACSTERTEEKGGFGRPMVYINLLITAEDQAEAYDMCSSIQSALCELPYLMVGSSSALKFQYGGESSL